MSCSCLTGFDVFAETSTTKWAESSREGHNIQISFTGGKNQVFRLDGIPNKGKSKRYSFAIDTSSECHNIFDVADITILARSTDGWNIRAIVTTFADDKGRTYSGSIDRNVNRWVDHKDKPVYESFVLNHN